MQGAGGGVAAVDRHLQGVPLFGRLLDGLLALGAVLAAQVTRDTQGHRHRGEDNSAHYTQDQDVHGDLWAVFRFLVLLHRVCGYFNMV